VKSPPPTHHRLKHEGGWGLDYINGVYIWTTPDGHQYTREPEPIAQPQPAPAPAPAKPQPEQAHPDDEPPPF
jgi:hypothetical protein